MHHWLRCDCSHPISTLFDRQITLPMKPQLVKSAMLAFGGPPSLKYAYEYYVKRCDEWQWHKHPLKADFNTRHPVVPWNPSENWCITFISPVSPAYNLNCYIITTKDYTKKWFKAKECPTVDTWETTKFLYENIMMRFGCPLKLISD